MSGDAAMVFLFDALHRTLMVRTRAGDHWMPPGGHIEHHDASGAHAACREVAEELNITCQPTDLRELGRCRKDLDDGTLTLYENRTVITSTIHPTYEVLEASWVPLTACSSLSMLPATRYGLSLLGPGTR
ncbi:MAG: NUDIX domain-containing protein [Haloechinothrix sp.]